MRTKWGKNHNKPTKSFIKGQLLTKLRMEFSKIAVVPLTYLDFYTSKEAEELYKANIEPIRKQAISDFHIMTRELPRKKKKKLRKTYQEFKQIW